MTIAVPASRSRARIKALLRALFGAPKSQHGPWMLAVGLTILVVSYLHWPDRHPRPWWMFVIDFVGTALSMEGFRALRNNGGGGA